MTHPRIRGRILALLLCGAALAAAGPALAAPGKDGAREKSCSARMMHGQAARISVVGEGAAQIAPDMATITLGVTTQAATATEAMAQNADQQGAVIEALTGSGIEDRDIQTSRLNLNPVMDYSRDNQPPTLTGYRAQNMVTVRVRDLDALSTTLDALVTAGANEITGIAFGRDEAAEVQDEARRDAVADARHRAEVMAEAAGLTLGPVLTMRDMAFSDGGEPRPVMMEAMDMGAAKSVPVASGELTLQARVEMQFALGGADCKSGGKARMRNHGKDGPKGASDKVEPVVPGAPPAGTITDAEAAETMEAEPNAEDGSLPTETGDGRGSPETEAPGEEETKPTN